MVIATRTIRDKLIEVRDMIDQTKCSAIFSEIPDGFALETTAFTEKVCSFRIEVTPHVFDLVALEHFGESDIEHERFDYYNILLSLIRGTAYVVNNGSFFRRLYLKIELDCNEYFYMTNNRMLFFNNPPPGIKFQSYML